MEFPSLDDFLEKNKDHMENIYSSDTTLQFQAVQRFRKILHNDDERTRKIIIDSGIVPRLIDLLKEDQNPTIQFESAWAVTNILSGTAEQTQFVVDLGAIPILVSLVRESKEEDVKAQAVWALGNIVGDGVDSRDRVLQAGALPVILDLIASPVSSSVKLETARNVAWILSNVFKKQPRPSFAVTQQCMPVLKKLLSMSDEEAIKDTCWSFSFIADGPTERIQLVIDSGALDRIAAILVAFKSRPEIARPAVRVLGSIAAGDDHQTDAVLRSGCLLAFSPLLSNPKDTLVKDVCWTISNITAGNDSQIQAVVEANLFPALISLCFGKAISVRKEALWAVGNVIDTIPGHSKREIVFHGASMPSPDPKVIVLVLSALKKMKDLNNNNNNINNSNSNSNSIAYYRSLAMLRKMHFI